MEKKRVISKIIDGALTVLIVILAMFLLISLYTAVQVKFFNNEYANFFGYSLFEVETGSMHGSIEAGDWIIVQLTKDAERNEIITYKHGNEFVTHRVVEIYKGSYVTKGDANNTKDEPIDREQVVGKVISTLHGFGIIRKVFFNPLVIIFLIICLYLFNLTFKTSKTKFDILIGKIIHEIERKIFKKDTKKKLENKKDVKEISEKKEDSHLEKKVDLEQEENDTEEKSLKDKEESDDDIDEETFLEDNENSDNANINDDDSSIEKESVEKKDTDDDIDEETFLEDNENSDNVIAVEEDSSLEKELIEKNDSNDEDISTKDSEEDNDNVITVDDEDTSLEKEEDLSKTALYRKIEVSEDDNLDEVDDISSEDEVDDNKEDDISNRDVHETIDVDTNEKEVPQSSEDEVSKTALYRFISVDEDDEEPPVSSPIEKEETKKAAAKKELPKKEKKSKLGGIKLKAEEITHRVRKKVINQKYIQDRINSKKAKNILDKTFMIKKIVYEEVLNVLLANENAYIIKSPMRKIYMEKYMETKYFGLDSERESIKAIMDDFSKELKGKYIRDERKVKTVNAYSKAFTLIDHLESKSDIDYRKEIMAFKKVDDERLDQMELAISNVMNYSFEYLKNLLSKLETTTFKEQYKKIGNQKDLYGVILDHNISFSKVYSDYIVDKTYSEGIVSEDKVAVLLNILMCKITEDLMNHDSDLKYVVYIPNALYEKDKKLEKIISTIDNDYAKTRIYFLTTATNMIKNEVDFNRLSKKGYHFAISFNEPIEYNNENLGYIYLANYYFIDTNLNKKEICKNLPKEIVSQLIEDDLEKKIGDYKGD